MITFLTVITVIGSILGGLSFFFGLATATGAPQQAAAAAAGMAFALIPYVLLRCAHMSEQRTTNAAILKALSRSEPPPLPR